MHHGFQYICLNLGKCHFWSKLVNNKLNKYFQLDVSHYRIKNPLISTLAGFYSLKTDRWSWQEQDTPSIPEHLISLPVICNSSYFKCFSLLWAVLSLYLQFYMNFIVFFHTFCKVIVFVSCFYILVSCRWCLRR